MLVEIENHLKNLMSAKYTNAQFDIHHTNGQVLMQVFNQSDVKLWNLPVELDFYKDGGIVIDLTFNKHKDDNTKNFKRFQTAPFYEKFILLEEGKTVKSYFHTIPNTVSLTLLADTLLNILQTVYDLRTKNVDMFFRVF